MKRERFLTVSAAALVAALGLASSATPASASDPIYMMPGQPGVTGPGVGGAFGANEFGNPNVSPMGGWVPDPYYRSDPYERANPRSSRQRTASRRSANAPTKGHNEAMAPKGPAFRDPFGGNRLSDSAGVGARTMISPA